MLDAKPAELVALGTVVVTPSGVTVHGFKGKGTSCRDVAALATAWAIGELQRELLATLEKPGGGRIGVGSAEALSSEALSAADRQLAAWGYCRER